MRTSIVYPVGTARALGPLGAVGVAPSIEMFSDPLVPPTAIAVENAAIQDAVAHPYSYPQGNPLPSSTLFSAVKACGDGLNSMPPRRDSLFTSIDANRDAIISRQELYAAINAGIIKDARPPVELWYDVKQEEKARVANSNETFLKTPPPVSNVSRVSTSDAFSPACISFSGQEGNGTDTSWQDGYGRSGTVSMSTSPPVQIPVQLMDGRARAASMAQPQTGKSARSSVFFAFGDNDSDEDDYEPMSRTERFNTTASTRSRAQSVPLSNQFSVSDVARRETLAAQALGVSKTAKRGTVAGAFYKGARKHHPDKGGKKDDFQVLREAYARLLLERS